jgi:hypothetical protein
VLGEWQPSAGKSLYAFDPEAILARFAAT